MKRTGTFLNLLAIAPLALVSLCVSSFLPTQQAEAATQVYDSFWDDVYDADIDVKADTFRCMLVTASYTFSKGTHAKRSDITNEVVGAGYTAGGAACTLTVSSDTTNHFIDITISDTSWTNSTITARGVVVYKFRGGAASADELVAEGDFGANISSTAATFTADFTSPIRISNN